MNILLHMTPTLTYTTTYRSKTMRLIFCACIILSFIPHISHAAVLIASSSQAQVHVGDIYSVDIMLDVKGEDINAVAGKINYPIDFLRIDSVDTKDSIISSWVKSPEDQSFSSDDVLSFRNGTISWSGIVPGGFTGVRSPRQDGVAPGRIFRVNFKAIAAGEPVFIFNNLEAYKNDGQGTSDVLTGNTFSVEIVGSGKLQSQVHVQNSSVHSAMSSIIILVILCFLALLSMGILQLWKRK